MLIYDQGDNYRASGALVDNDVVVTVAHKVLNYVDRASSLKVRLGDWNPNGRDVKGRLPNKIFKKFREFSRLWSDFGFWMN